MSSAGNHRKRSRRSCRKSRMALSGRTRVNYFRGGTGGLTGLLDRLRRARRRENRSAKDAADL